MAKQSSIILWRDLHEIAEKVCGRFELCYGKIIPEINKSARYFGVCWPCEECINAGAIDVVNCNEKIIRIRVNRLNNPQIPLTRKTVLQTLVHELAHLREWKHGERFDIFESEVLKFVRELGYGV